MNNITPKFNFLLRWKPIHIQYYIDSSYNENAKSTYVLWRNRFGRIISKNYYGLEIPEEIFNETK